MLANMLATCDNALDLAIECLQDIRDKLNTKRAREGWYSSVVKEEKKHNRILIRATIGCSAEQEAQTAGAQEGQKEFQACQRHMRHFPYLLYCKGHVHKKDDQHHRGCRRSTSAPTTSHEQHQCSQRGYHDCGMAWDAHQA